LLSFVAIAVHRRVLWFKTPTQAMQLLPLFAAAHAMELLLRVMFGASWPDWQVMLAPLLESALWPVISVLLLMPQRRTPDPDATRPL
jgi:rod shape-determining protein MreD